MICPKSSKSALPPCSGIGGSRSRLRRFPMPFSGQTGGPPPTRRPEDPVRPRIGLPIDLRVGMCGGFSAKDRSRFRLDVDAPHATGVPGRHRMPVSVSNRKLYPYLIESYMRRVMPVLTLIKKPYRGEKFRILLN